MANLNIESDLWHPDRNYTIKPSHPTEVVSDNATERRYLAAGDSNTRQFWNAARSSIIDPSASRGK
jgi:hypothetical protein